MALTDPAAVQDWLPPSGSRAIVEELDPRPGGAIRMTLVFDGPGATGSRKSSPTTDVVEGEFVELAPDRLVRQRFRFLSENPVFAGTMVMSWTLAPVADGTQVTVAAENVPVGISSRDHETGMASSLAQLARWVER